MYGEPEAERFCISLGQQFKDNLAQREASLLQHLQGPGLTPEHAAAVCRDLYTLDALREHLGPMFNPAAVVGSSKQASGPCVGPTGASPLLAGQQGAGPFSPAAVSPGTSDPSSARDQEQPATEDSPSPLLGSSSEPSGDEPLLLSTALLAGADAQPGCLHSSQAIKTVWPQPNATPGGALQAMRQLAVRTNALLLNLGAAAGALASDAPGAVLPHNSTPMTAALFEAQWATLFGACTHKPIPEFPASERSHGAPEPTSDAKMAEEHLRRSLLLTPDPEHNDDVHELFERHLRGELRQASVPAEQIEEMSRACHTAKAGLPVQIYSKCAAKFGNPA
mmetsp:Transcript_14652/g.36490  ORF Transcript_14652/g.36490 Transcript_14652/m.36490 type:complete len:336 (+) Transcript_14652:202-1209(+)